MSRSMATLGAIAAPKGLQTGPFGSQLKAEEYTEHGVPVIMPKDICNGKILPSGIARVPEEKAKKLAKHRIITGDILFPRRGNLGRIGVATEENEGWLCGSGCLRARLKDSVDTEYIHQYVQLASVKQWLESNALGQTMLNLNSEIIGNLPIFLVPQKEQTVIAALLSTWDTVIEKMDKMIAAKEQRIEWLLSKLISKSKYSLGHIRDFTSEVSKRNSGEEIDGVLSVTNNRGFILPADQFARRIASSDLSNYKVVTSGQYAYNPSRINVGSIARLDDWDKGVLSPMYVVFKVNEKKVTSDFFLHWLSSHEAKGRIRRSAQGSVRETVSFTDLGAIPFPLPSLERQQQIAETLNTAQHEIDLLKKQAEAYCKQKRGLMQKLLTGEWRVKVK